ncbi:MAG: hypothetical protein EAZ86_20755 [Oscillatoriales cyanobacterium]|nr:MAG: hypothetical protein EAZ86_20755 [Oscillatoriales cyanobacterium]
MRSIVSSLRSTVNPYLSQRSFQLSNDFGFWILDFGFWIGDWGLSTVNCQLSTVNCQLLYQAQLAERYWDAMYLDTKPQNN